MTQDQLIILLFKCTSLACLVSTVAFVCVYTALAPWWKNPIGRTLVQLDILLAFALTPAVLAYFFHFSRLTSRVAAWTDITIFALIAVTMFARIPLWFRMHRRNAGIQAEETSEQRP